ncbi:MAG: hypothetical protein JXA92_11530, partial [candidate division Zixibacteria bacterium]|nr:hypothetical protein [candidate division Zixibacteria bacterium]
MTFKTKYHGRTAVLTVFILAVLVFSSLYISSCSDRISGTKNANRPPQVYFVNIPPDGYKESFNDVIHWVGTDYDGQVTLFRYVVVKAAYIDTAAGESAASFADFLRAMSPNDSSFVLDGDTLNWTFLPVTIDDPQTSQIVSMSASLTNPVLEFVPQYVFLQAFDDEGLSSEVVFKLILRNDYPPDTRIIGIDLAREYINAVTAGGVNTGIPVRWEGEDPDLEDTLFQFQWKLFGPYKSDTVAGGPYEDLIDSFVKVVFVTRTAELYYYGIDTFFILVDSSYVCDTIEDTCYVEIDSQTIYIDDFTPHPDSIGQWGIYGQFDTLFDVTDPDFIADTNFNKLRQTSDGWITSVRDTLYDVYPTVSDPAADTTRGMKFIFWVQARDAAQVVDLTPDYKAINVIQPKYERDILVIDFSKIGRGRINAPYKSVDGMYEIDTAVHYWDSVITNWSINEGIVTDFDITPMYPDLDPNQKGQYVDYIYSSKAGDKVALRRMLQHKILILYSDDVNQSGITTGPGGQPTAIGRNVYIALEAGVNVWLTMRAPIIGSFNDSPRVGANLVIPDDDYAEHFGVDPVYGMVYSGWGYHSFDLEADSIYVNGEWIPNPIKRPHRRIEDFVGAISLNPGKWPDLEIDTNQLNRRYYWFPDGPVIKGFSYNDTLPMSYVNPRIFKPAELHALPEVNWSSRVYGTEGMYLYKSYYGLDHPLGFDYSFDGAPVAHRYNTGLYKTVHFCFTPLSLKDETMQVVIDSVLHWLYPQDALAAPPTSLRYPDAKV